MIYWIVSCVLVFAVSAFLAGLLIPQILLISFRRKLFDAPDERKIHHGTVPRLGGIAFKPVIFFSLSLMLGMTHLLGYTQRLAGIGKEMHTLAFGFCSVMMLYIIGMADDLIGIKYRAKFVVQVLCGLCMVAGGLWLNDMHGMAGIGALPLAIGAPLTVVAVVFIINAVNLIDGVDGLCSGLCSAACVFMGLILLHTGDYVYAALAFATLGVLMPFFCYNVFGNASKMSKIFMGDTGSTTIGMLLCLLAFKVLRSHTAGTAFEGVNPFVLAFSPLIVPCFDVVRVYIHRVRTGNNPFLPDKNHIHHKLLALGLRQRRVMVSIIAFSVGVTLANIILSSHVNATILLLADIALWTLSNIWLSARIRRKQA